MVQRYDLIVIGSGTAAQVASSQVKAAGWTVAVVDHRPFGGTCALRGCDPKKVLVSGTEAVDAAPRMHKHGIEGSLRIEWADLIALKRTFHDPTGLPRRPQCRLHHSSDCRGRPGRSGGKGARPAFPRKVGERVGLVHGAAPGERVYGYKTLVEEGSGRILGAHLVGPHADEVINLLGLAIRHGLTTVDLEAAIFAHPTGASDIAYIWCDTRPYMV